MNPNRSIVPSMYVLIWDAELVTFPSPKISKPHLEATAMIAVLAKV